MAYGTRVAFEPIREVAFGGIGVAYAVFGGILTDYTRLITISNGTDDAIYVSFDGINDHLRLEANTFKLFDFTANKVRDDGLFLSQRTQVYLKRVLGAPTTGTATLEVMFAAGGI